MPKPWENAEGYHDPTAYHGTKNIIRDEDEQQKRVNTLIFVLKYITRLAGFELLNRIEIKDRKTGREYREGIPMMNKPCPFCGGEPFFMDCDGWYWVRCRKCGVETPGSDIIEIAENQWNRRVNDDEENAGGAGPDAVLDGRGGALQH